MKPADRENGVHVPNRFGGSFHHIGLACRSLEIERLGLAPVGYVAEGPAIHDPIQRVRVQFLSGGGPRLELVEPAADDSPINGLLKRGTRLYHVAYEVTAFDTTIGHLEARGGYRCLAAPAPAVAFNMRRIVFMMSATGTLIELIQAAA